MFRRIDPRTEANAGVRQRRSLDELVGLCRGVIADGIINAEEIGFVQRWLEQHRGLEQVGDVGQLIDRLGDALADGVIDGDEERDLLDTLLAFTLADVPANEERQTLTPDRVRPAPASLHGEIAALPYDDPPPRIRFDGGLFVVTGTFNAGSRVEIVATITSRGGLVQKDVTQTTHYLVVGTLGSDRWVHGSSGRKIDKAAALRADGLGIAIVSEAEWAAQLQRA